MQRQLFCLVILVALIIAAAPTTAHPLRQEATASPRIVVDTTVLEEPDHANDEALPALNVVFTVLDPNGTPIKNPLIDRIDITLDNDQPREATFQEADSTAMPMYIALLLDASRSMQDSIGDVRRAAIRSLGETPPGTFFMVFRFSDIRTSALPEGEIMTQERTVAEDAIRSIEVDANTCLYDSISATIQDLRREVPHNAARRALIVFTDGVDERLLPDGSTEPCSIDTLSDVVANARESGNRAGEVPVPLYTIGLCDATSPSNPCTQEEEVVQDDTTIRVNPLGYLAGETGGIAATGTLDEISSSFDQIMDRLNSQWIAYNPVPARRGQNQGTLEVYLDGSATPITTRFTFVSRRDYRGEEQGPAINIASSPIARFSEGVYELPLRISNAQDIEQIIVRVEDEASETEIESAQTIIDRATLTDHAQDEGSELIAQINAEDFVVGQQYEFVVYATDSTGQPIQEQTNEGLREELARQVIIHQSDIEFEVTASPQIPNDRIELDIALVRDIEDDLRYRVEVEDVELDHEIGEVDGVLEENTIVIDTTRSSQQEEILAYMQSVNEAREYEFRVHLWKDGGDATQGATSMDRETIVPIGLFARVIETLLSPWVWGTGLVLVLGVVGYSVYQRRRNVREPPPPPQNLPTNMITPEVEALPATPKGQMQIKVRVLQTVGSSRQKRESIQTTPFSIGRGRENHVRIASDPNISRKHIEVTASGEAFYVTDTSRNGTYLNDKRQEEGQCSRPLTRRVEVGLGPHTRIELERQDN